LNESGVKARPLLLLPILLVLIGAVAYLLFWWNGGDESILEFSGNLEATEVDIAFKTPGRVIAIHFDEGDPVQEGELVAELDHEQLLARRRELRAQLGGIQSRKEELLALIRFQEESVRAQISQRRAEKRQTEAQLDLLREGSRQQEIDQARALVAATLAEADRAREDWDRAKDLYLTEDISRSQYDSARAAHERLQAELQRARHQLDLVEEGPRIQEVNAAAAAVERAEAGLRQAEAGELEIRRNRQTLQTLEAEVEAVHARLEQLESLIADARVYSPITGIVLVRSVESGETVSAGTPVLSVGDLSRPWVRGYVPETRLAAVRIGAAVQITTDTWPGKVYPGRIVYLADEAEFTPKQIETREERVKMVYRIKVEVDNPHGELKLNMPVDGRIALTPSPAERGSEP
jgi:HlyD family secretion protein